MAYIGNAPAAGIVDSGNILDGSINTADLADAAVTAAKLAAAAITDKLGYTPLNKAGDTISGNGQRLLFSGTSDPGLQINDTSTGANPDGFLFVDTSDGGTLDIEGSNGVNINGLNGVTVAKAGPSGGLDLVLGDFKHKGLTSIQTIGRSYLASDTASSTDVADTWYSYPNTLQYVRKSGESKIVAKCTFNVGIAYSNPSGVNHGYVAVRLLLSGNNGSTTTSDSQYWTRVDAFSGVFEWTGPVVLEWTANAASLNSIVGVGQTLNITPQYKLVRTVGTGIGRGGIGTWSGKSIIYLEENVGW
jgi:hypothetical protein